MQSFNVQVGIGAILFFIVWVLSELCPNASKKTRTTFFELAALTALVWMVLVILHA